MRGVAIRIIGSAITQWSKLIAAQLNGYRDSRRVGKDVILVETWLPFTPGAPIRQTIFSPDALIKGFPPPGGEHASS